MVMGAAMRHRYTRVVMACAAFSGGIARDAVAQTAYDRLTHASTAVVLATVEAEDLMMQPEASPAVPLRQQADGTWAVTLSEDLGIRGTVVRVRIDEVLKRDEIVAVGSRIDIYDPVFAAVAPRWNAQVGAQYALFLRREAYTDRQRLERALVMRRRAPASTDSGTLINLEDTYSLVSAARGVVRTDSLRPDALASLRDDVVNAARPRVTLTNPAVGAVLIGQVTLSASASDDGGVAGVQFQVDGQNVGWEVRQRPFQYLWRSKSVPNGAHTVAATARDGTGETVTASVAVTTANTNVAPQVSADPTSHVGGAKFFTWSWSDPDGDPLSCQFEVLQPAQCTYGGNCLNVGGSASGSTSCQAKVGLGQPGGTACDYRLTCDDGWAAPISASFHLYYPD